MSRKLFNEIGEIKAGIWDERIQAEVAQAQAQIDAEDKSKKATRGTKRKADEEEPAPKEAASVVSTEAELPDPKANQKKAPVINLKKPPPARGARRSARGHTVEQAEDTSMEIETPASAQPTEPEEEVQEEADDPKTQPKTTRKGQSAVSVRNKS